MKSFMVHLVKLKKKKVPTIICGDWNIAHKEIDLKIGNQIRKILDF